MKIIALDLGSNSLTILKYECTEDKILDTFLKTVRTAEGLIDNNIISDSAIDRVVNAINEAKDKIDFSDSKVKAVTTQALRVASNANEVISTIEKSCNIEFEVISSKKEGELTLQAVAYRLSKLKIDQDFVLVDIGGGSTELSYYIDGKIYSKSFDLGIVTTANSCKSLEEIDSFVKDRSKEIALFAEKFNTNDLIFTATAGTPTTIAAMKHNLIYKTYDANIVTGTKLTLQELDFYLNRLLNMSKKDREVTVGVGRDDLIVAGIVIFKEIYNILNKSESIIIDDGLSMGVAISECKK